MINRISGAIMILGAVGIVIGLPIFAGIRDSKGLQSTAPICHIEEAFEDCLPPLPELDG